MGESTAVESYGVDAAVGYRFASRDDVWRYIFVDFCAALYHAVCADMAKLVYQTTAAYDSPVIYNDFACQLSSIGHDDMVMQYTVVCDVAVCHDEAVVAHNGFAFAGSTAVDSHELADSGVIANDGV